MSSSNKKKKFSNITEKETLNHSSDVRKIQNILDSDESDNNDKLQENNTLQTNNDNLKENNDQLKIQNEDLNLKYYFLSIAATFILAVCVLHFFPQKKINLDGLKEKFPNQPNETFDYFEAVVDDIVFIHPQHPAVFLFLYDGNELKVNNLVHHLAEYASQKLETNRNYIDVAKDEFHSTEALKDYGYLIDKYKLDLVEKQVMVVRNLQNIPATVAQVFHSFCDEITPLVDRVVYIFTLKVDSIIGKEETIAERNLKNHWKQLDNDILMPLITRVTSTVLKVLN